MPAGGPPASNFSMIEIISATRLSESDFWNKAALGLSLRRLEVDSRLVVYLVFGNHRGLPEIFNARISAPDGPDLLAFIHDDVWIDDFFFVDRIAEGLKVYDVIGIAGNRRRVEHQPSWAFLDKVTLDERANLVGRVAHGPRPFGQITLFGDAPAECELLDGVFLAGKKSVLTTHGVLFDPRFDFHFYDMDFCRSARQNGLRLGTWPICLTHQSRGSFATDSWTEGYRRYIDKWKS
jgi:hypothetical protein